MANEATIQKKGTHYAWWVMIGYGMLMCATIAPLRSWEAFSIILYAMSWASIFSTFTFYVTLSMIFMALGMPVCGKILSSGKLKLSALLTIAVLLILVPFACMSLFTELWMWYVAAVPIGLGLSACSTVTAAPTLSNWFHKKTGFAIGMIFTIQSIFCRDCEPYIYRHH